MAKLLESGGTIKGTTKEESERGNGEARGAAVGK
jgi:hypothetical protein